VLEMSQARLARFKPTVLRAKRVCAIKAQNFFGLCRVNQSVKTVAQFGLNHVVHLLGHAGPSPARIFDHIKSKYYNYRKFITY
jgi:hypothetical protein